VRIANRELGPDEPVYVIAELGVNHDGDVGKALALTQAAATAKADAVKLQFFETDRLMSSAAKLAAYQAEAGETDPITMLRRLEMGLDDMATVVDRAHELGLHAIVTVFSVELVQPATELFWDAFKSASPDIVHRPLLEAMAFHAGGRPLIVSTGASTPDEINRAHHWLGKAKDRLAYLQCVSSYPAPDAALEGIGAIASITGTPIGYSDHTESVQTGAEAVAAGACLLERHLTLDKAAPGPDHAASLEPDEFAKYVGLARMARCGINAERYKPDKRVLGCERDVREVSRQSIVSTRRIDVGEVIERADLAFKRPGTGLAPWQLDQVLGQMAMNPIEADTPIKPSDLD
jgi:N,N'-diacetyllegionaminate synthase